MNQLKAWGLSVAVMAGMGMPAVIAADTASAAKPADTTPWYKRVFSSSKDKDAGARGVAPAKPIATAPLTPEVLAEAVDSEQKAWQRRIEVCTELRRVAIDKNDEALLRQVDELERQATTLYNQRTAALGVKKAKGPAASAVLDHTLGSGAAVTPLTASNGIDLNDNTRTAQSGRARR